jgi:hypothetical protein
VAQVVGTIRRRVLQLLEVVAAHATSEIEQWSDFY